VLKKWFNKNPIEQFYRKLSLYYQNALLMFYIDPKRMNSIPRETNKSGLPTHKKQYDKNSPLSGHLYNIEKTYNELRETLEHINYLISNITNTDEHQRGREGSAA
jgi:hypothetical protein